jgi:hypothetical protein
MNPKKVAICISGIDRSLDFCINTLKKNLIECNSERYEFYTIGYITSDNHINKLNFDKLILSTEFVNNETNETSKLPLPNLSYQKEHYIGGQYLQCYYQLKGLYEVNKLRIKYERENNITFDYLIRYRTDLNLLSNLNLDIIKKNTVYIPYCHDWNGYNDRFAIGDRNVMNTYFNRYEFWMNNNDHIENYTTHAETNLKIFLNVNNINIDRLDFDYALRRSSKYHKWVRDLYNVDEIDADGCVSKIQFFGNKNIINYDGNKKMINAWVKGDKLYVNTADDLGDVKLLITAHNTVIYGKDNINIKNGINYWFSPENSLEKYHKILLEIYKGGSSIYQKEILSNEKLGKNVLL